VRKSKEETARTRERIVDAAAKDFREKGIEATGLAELMASAGLTHGGFYRHFESKDQLIREALGSAVESEARWIASLTLGGSKHPLKKLVRSYLSPAHRDSPAGGCPFAALGSELTRLQEDGREVVNQGLSQIVALIAPKIGGASADTARLNALVAFSTMVGAMTLARIIDDEKLSNTLLREAASRVGGGGGRVPGA